MLLAALTDWIRDAVVTGGYPALAALIFLENIFPPIPSEVILPLAGFYVGQGDIEFLPAMVASTLGSVVGALVLYGISRASGRPLIYAAGPKVRVSHRDLDRADAWFDRYGPWLVLFGRMIPGIRSLISVPAGLSEMPVWRFLALTTIGSAAWNALLIGAGWMLGDRWEEVESVVGPISTLALGVLVVGTLVGALWIMRRRMRPARVRT